MARTTTPRRGGWLAVLTVVALAAWLMEGELPGNGSAEASDPSGARAGSALSTPGATPSPSAGSPTASPSARPGTALAAVAGLVVRGRGSMTGYSRDAFGQAWYDADRNGCDTRNDVLRRDLRSRSMKNGCKVLAGTLRDPYTGDTVRFVGGGSSEVDVDHVVALGDAWQKGAARWRTAKRLAFANDPLNLVAVGSGVNRSKGDGDTATWLPPSKPGRCVYVARQVAVKKKYQVSVTSAERDAMVRVLDTCPQISLPRSTAPTTAPLPRVRATPRPLRATPVQPRALVRAPTSVGTVHPGAFCSPVGALGETNRGTPMACSEKAGDSRARWRSR